MRLSRSCHLALASGASAAVASASSEPVLPAEITSVPMPSQTLCVSFPQPTGGKNVEVEQPGKTLQPNQSSLQPLLYYKDPPKDAPAGQIYVAMMLDPDASKDLKAPNPDTAPPVPGSTILHWLWGNLTLNAHNHRLEVVDPDNVYNDPNDALAAYIGPGPAPGITKPVHDYTLMLFAQPDGFNLPKVKTAAGGNYTKFLPITPGGSMNRAKFPYAKFIKDFDLGAPVAANWFREDTPACNGTYQSGFGFCPSGTVSKTAAGMDVKSTKGPEPGVTSMSHMA